MKEKAKRFAELTAKQKADVSARFIRAFDAFSLGGRYEAVEGETKNQRAPSFIEFFGEDKILPFFNRSRLINLSRNAMRSASLARTIDQQRRVNIVGSNGGKLLLSFSDEAADKAAKPWENWFNFCWAPQAEFTDGVPFNELLKLALSCRDVGGDCILLFDDGTLCDSGKIRAFEADEIQSLRKADFDKTYGTKGWTQSQGRIADKFGRTVGAVVSPVDRGLAEFSPDRSFVLTRDPLADRCDSYWVFLRYMWRFNQGRGVSPLSSAISPLEDIHEIVGSETQSAKINSKMVGQLLDEREIAENPNIPADYSPASPDDAAAASSDDSSSDAADVDVQKSFASYDSIGAIFDLMPPKMKMELLDTKRPNPNLPQFIDWLVGSVTGVYGMGRLYASLNPEASYTAFRGAQCLARPSFEEAQKDLERYVCDWAARNAIRWGIRHHVLPHDPPEGWEKSFSWQWPKMAEVNELDSENAIEKKLSNMTENYHHLFGPNWQERLQQTFDEVDFFAKCGKVHPSQKTVSGGVIKIEGTKKDE